MSKCIKCGNLFINNPPDGEVCHRCQIADLKEQLAEKEKEIDLMQGHIEVVNRTNKQYADKCKNLEIEAEHWFKLVEEKNNTITNLIEDSNASKELLKQQLAEKETEHNKLQKLFDATNKPICTLEELRKIILEGEESSDKKAIEMLNNEVAYLEKQLAEKEKEVKKEVVGDLIIDIRSLFNAYASSLINYCIWNKNADGNLKLYNNFRRIINDRLEKVLKLFDERIDRIQEGTK